MKIWAAKYLGASKTNLNLCISILAMVIVGNQKGFSSSFSQVLNNYSLLNSLLAEWLQIFLLYPLFRCVLEPLYEGGVRASVRPSVTSFLSSVNSTTNHCVTHLIASKRPSMLSTTTSSFSSATTNLLPGRIVVPNGTCSHKSLLYYQQ